MLAFKKTLPVLLGTIPLLLAGHVCAQCSGGRAGGMRGAPDGGARASIPVAMIRTDSAPGRDLLARAYAQQSQMQRLIQAQQRMLATRQQWMRQRAEEHYDQQQKLLAIRQQRARTTREKRAERIAQAKAKRAAASYGDQQSPSQRVNADPQSGSNDSLFAFSQ